MVAVVLVAGVAMQAHGGEPIETRRDVILQPDPGTEISGYQVLSIRYDFTRKLAIRAVTYDDGHGAKRLDTTENPLRYDPGHYSVILCAQCLRAKKVTVAVEFTPDSHVPKIIRTYAIAHLPVIRVKSAPIAGEPGMLKLDASASFDPEGGPLKLEWYLPDGILTGPSISVPATIVRDSQVVVKATTLRGRDAIVYFPQEPKKQKAATAVQDENLTCTGMEVIDSGISLLNPELKLGPSLKEGTQLELKADKKTLAKDYTLYFGFEVRANIMKGDKILQEGQDAARTLNYNQSSGDHSKPEYKNGEGRKSRTSSDLDGTKRDAPFPDSPSPPDDWNKMVEDDYSFHPINAQAQNFGDKPDAWLDIKMKGMHLTPPNTRRIIWDDQPGLETLRAGADISKGMTYKAYFRAWMDPDITKCEKFFKVEEEIDANGVVKTNKLTPLP
ncbi:MAG TPA: hypothetical protein VEI03_08705 [Stellaceae bacterium]|nr:hypothetical protein [Stellaceae bacterium]